MPSTIPAGTSVSYTRTFTDYRADDGWTLAVHLAGPDVPGAAAVTIAASGSSFVVTLSAAMTAKLRPGTYQWQERVAKAGAVYVAASGTVIVEPDIASANAGDLQPTDEQLLEVVEAALANRLTADMQSYQIGGRSVTKIPAAELYDLRTRLRSAVDQARNAGTFGRNVDLTFLGPTS